MRLLMSLASFHTGKTAVETLVVVLIPETCTEILLQVEPILTYMMVPSMALRQMAAAPTILTLINFEY